MIDSEKMVWASEFVRCVGGSWRRDRVLAACESAACAVQRLHDYLNRETYEEIDEETLDQALEMIGKARVAK